MIVRQRAVATLSFFARFAGRSTFSDAFTTSLSSLRHHKLIGISDHIDKSILLSATNNDLSNDDDDCGCATTTATIFSGKPSDSAKILNAREAVRQKQFFTVNGESTKMDDLIGQGTQNNNVSIVVFLRSLG